MYYYLILGCNREKIDSLHLEYYDGHSLLSYNEELNHITEIEDLIV